MSKLFMFFPELIYDSRQCGCVFTRYMGNCKAQDRLFEDKARLERAAPCRSFYNGIFTLPFGGGNAHDLLKNRLKIALRRKREAGRYLDQRLIGEHQIVTRLVDLFFVDKLRHGLSRPLFEVDKEIVCIGILFKGGGKVEEVL